MFKVCKKWIHCFCFSFQFEANFISLGKNKLYKCQAKRFLKPFQFKQRKYHFQLFQSSFQNSFIIELWDQNKCLHFGVSMCFMISFYEFQQSILKGQGFKGLKNKAFGGNGHDQFLWVPAEYIKRSRVQRIKKQSIWREWPGISFSRTIFMCWGYWHQQIPIIKTFLKQELWPSHTTTLK